MNFLNLKAVGFVTPEAQIILVAILFAVTVITQYWQYVRTGKMYGHYPVSISILFVPIYEEVIFRGLILGALVTTHSTISAIIISSVLFGLWHLKNIFFLPKGLLIRQIFYTGMIFGPLMAIIVILSGSIWPAVILHYLNNIIAGRTKRIKAS